MQFFETFFHKLMLFDVLSWGKTFSESQKYPIGYFWRCEIDKNFLNNWPCACAKDNVFFSFERGADWAVPDLLAFKGTPT